MAALDEAIGDVVLAPSAVSSVQELIRRSARDEVAMQVRRIAGAQA